MDGLSQSDKQSIALPDGIIKASDVGFFHEYKEALLYRAYSWVQLTLN